MAADPHEEEELIALADNVEREYHAGHEAPDIVVTVDNAEHQHRQQDEVPTVATVTVDNVECIYHAGHEAPQAAVDNAAQQQHQQPEDLTVPTVTEAPRIERATDNTDFSAQENHEATEYSVVNFPRDIPFAREYKNI